MTVPAPAVAGPVEVDGQPVDAGRAAALTGLSYGHFGAMVVDELRVTGLQLHLDRLVRDCAVVHGSPLDPDRVRAHLRQVALRGDRPTMLRATVFDPGLSPARPGSAGPSVLVTTRALTSGPPPTGLRVRTAGFVRDLPAVKHLGTFGQLYQRRLAQRAGFDDALFLTGPEPSALLCEGPTWNVAVLIGDELVWPDDQCLPGVTRELVRPAAAAVTRSVTRAELAGARAAFATSAGVGVVAITEVDGVALPGDPHLLETLRSAYAELPTETL